MAIFFSDLPKDSQDFLRAQARVAEADSYKMPTAERDYEAEINNPAFAYARAGDGLFRGRTLVYHWKKDSPTGVWMHCSGPAEIIEPLIRKYHSTSPLSPTERR